MILYTLCIVLFLVGLFGVMTKRNLIKIVIGLCIMQYSVYMLLILVGYIEGATMPIIGEEVAGRAFVDPLPQAMVLTAIVIGLATTALLMAVAIRIYEKHKTFDVTKINTLKG